MSQFNNFDVKRKTCQLQTGCKQRLFLIAGKSESQLCLDLSPDSRSICVPSSSSLRQDTQVTSLASDPVALRTCTDCAAVHLLSLFPGS